MTPQKIFTTAFLGVIGQGCLSENADGVCQYRSDLGAKCVIGWLIDDRTAAEFGGRVIRCIARKRLPGHIRDNFDLCVSMQEAHDFAAMWSEGVAGFRHRMIKVAARYNLEVPDV